MLARRAAFADVHSRIDLAADVSAQSATRAASRPDREDERDVPLGGRNPSLHREGARRGDGPDGSFTPEPTRKSKCTPSRHITRGAGGPSATGAPPPRGAASPASSLRRRQVNALGTRALKASTTLLWKHGRQWLRPRRAPPPPLKPRASPPPHRWQDLRACGESTLLGRRILATGASCRPAFFKSRLGVQPRHRCTVANGERVSGRFRRDTTKGTTARARPTTCREQS